jgi:hypothetical protein
MSLRVDAQICQPACAKPEDSNKLKETVITALQSFARPIYLWFLNNRQDIFKWLAVGVATGVAVCAASFGLAHLLSYFGIAGAFAAVGAMGARGIVSAVIRAPIKAWHRSAYQKQLREPIGELQSLLLVNVISTIALLPIAPLPLLLRLLNSVLNGVALALPAIAQFSPNILNSMNLGGRRWLFATAVCLLLESVITVCCFGFVKSGIFLFVNIPVFIMFFVLHYIDKQSNSLIPSAFTSIGTILVSLATNFLL